MGYSILIREILQKALDGASLSREEITSLFRVPLFSEESAMMLAASRRKSEHAGNGLAEVHAQVGLNIAPCPRNCSFCSFAAKNKVFTERVEISAEEAVAKAKQLEGDGANAVYIMSTADYSFEKFVNISREIRKSLRPETVLVANIGDFTREQAKKLKDTGFVGIYHAVRLGEGRDTTIPVNKRLMTFKNAREAGLSLGTCVEPVGNEHSIEELVEKTIITRDAKPVYSGAARRIPAAGANLLWAEAGANPRDTEKETEGKRGMTVKECIKVFEEAEWHVLQGPSKFYGA